jgi:hypothetical protein
MTTLLKEDTDFAHSTTGTSMSHYFVNNAAQPDGSHEVHALGCSGIPVDKSYLGNFDNTADAMIEARKDFWQAKPCEKCGHGRLADSTTVRARIRAATSTSASGIHSLLGKFT